jgi:hypothetical protein
MDTFIEILQVITNNLIRGIFISVLFVIIIARFFKSLDTKYAFNILQWLIISYAIAGIILMFMQLITQGLSSFTRATGPYWFAYWIIILGSCIFPFALLFRKFANKKYFILLVAVIINLGWLFESFVIHVTTIHRDYLPPSDNNDSFITYLLPFKRELIVVTKGLLLGIFVILAGNLISKTKHKNHIHDTQ